MTKYKGKKEFDAVEMMRNAREQISAETQNMSLTELKEYIARKLGKDDKENKAA